MIRLAAILALLLQVHPAATQPPGPSSPADQQSATETFCIPNLDNGTQTCFTLPKTVDKYPFPDDAPGADQPSRWHFLTDLPRLLDEFRLRSFASPDYTYDY